MSIVICGAGIAGISTAYWLAVKHGIGDVLLVDERPPLTLTSDKSTECYRNFWPGPGDAIVRLMDRSIDLLEELARESSNIFHMNRRGYVYTTQDPERVALLQADAEESSALGAGPLRIHAAIASDRSFKSYTTYNDKEGTGLDLITSPDLIQQQFPCLSPRTVAVLYARRAGWLSAQQLGAYMLEKAREHGAKFLRVRVTGIETRAGRVHGVTVTDESGDREIPADVFINAAGPFFRDVGKLAGSDLPVFHELHAKVNFRDDRGIVPRNSPMFICADPIRLPWSDEEKLMLAESEETRWLVDEFPPGAHTRPEGGDAHSMLLMLWPYHTPPVETVFPPPIDPYYTDVVLRGLSVMIPGLSCYFDSAARPHVDGGYYTKTRENRPLIGPASTPGTYVIGALSGYGIMAAPAAAELLAAHITSSKLPGYANEFTVDRFDDPAYQSLLEKWPDTGQL